MFMRQQGASDQQGNRYSHVRCACRNFFAVSGQDELTVGHIITGLIGGNAKRIMNPMLSFRGQE